MLSLMHSKAYYVRAVDGVVRAARCLPASVATPRTPLYKGRACDEGRKLMIQGQNLQFGGGAEYAYASWREHSHARAHAWSGLVPHG